MVTVIWTEYAFKCIFISVWTGLHENTSSGVVLIVGRSIPAWSDVTYRLTDKMSIYQLSIVVQLGW